ncbi:MAG: hypothetical protein H6767_03685 [Candidatus Peribacteria bacterium]|nr:MAG: hypothetical protein H6767_03685 [Candidatus Peribacteria bacterium]
MKFPFGHPILHNYLSLKIIHHKSSPKQVLIITSDIRSRNIGKPIGIEYSIIQDE